MHGINSSSDSSCKRSNLRINVILLMSMYASFFLIGRVPFFYLEHPFIIFIYIF